MIFEGKIIEAYAFYSKRLLSLAAEKDDRKNDKSGCSRYRRGRLSYLLARAPAKRLRRWISINCPTSSCVWSVSQVFLNESRSLFQYQQLWQRNCNLAIGR